jgi:hypothetical protein
MRRTGRRPLSPGSGRGAEKLADSGRHGRRAELGAVIPEDELIARRLCLFAFLICLAPPTLAQTPEPTQPQVEEAAPPVEATSEPPAKPVVPRFQTRSGTRAGGPANELNTGDERAKEELPGGSATDAVTGADLYHGNYCGKGSRGAGLPPTDQLDAACKAHDDCYEAKARRACECDTELRRNALVVSNMTRLSRELRARALSVAEAAELMPCE